jgi:hypothetical protein
MNKLPEISALNEDEFRDTIATVDANGKRIWLHPKKPKGSFHNKRIIATIIFLAIFFSVPFIKIDGQPLLMMNIFERKFVIFGQAFFPQDFVLFGIGMITFFVFIILFTVVYGRFWCGWACPQTVFLEMIFRKIEYWIEGDARQQHKLDSGPWTSEKKKENAQAFYIYNFFGAYCPLHNGLYYRNRRNHQYRSGFTCRTLVRFYRNNCFYCFILFCFYSFT